MERGRGRGTLSPTLLPETQSGTPSPNLWGSPEGGQVGPYHRTCWDSGGSDCCRRVFPRRSRSSKALLAGGGVGTGALLVPSWAGVGAGASGPSEDCKAGCDEYACPFTPDKGMWGSRGLPLARCHPTWKLCQPEPSRLGPEGGVGSLRPVGCAGEGCQLPAGAAVPGFLQPSLEGIRQYGHNREEAWSLPLWSGMPNALPPHWARDPTSWD